MKDKCSIKRGADGSGDDVGVLDLVE